MTLNNSKKFRDIGVSGSRASKGGRVVLIYRMLWDLIYIGLYGSCIGFL